MAANSGAISLGMSHDTPEFSVESLSRWWRANGRTRYPHARDLLILADSGGSNGPKSRASKLWIQEKLCDYCGLSVTVAHYPSGASKCKPIAHRLFPEMSKNWAGRPLDSYKTCLPHIRTTRTMTALTVKAYIDKREYHRGIKTSKAQMWALNIDSHKTVPELHHTLRPNENGD